MQNLTSSIELCEVFHKILLYNFLYSEKFNKPMCRPSFVMSSSESYLNYMTLEFTSFQALFRSHASKELDQRAFLFKRKIDLMDHKKQS